MLITELVLVERLFMLFKEVDTALYVWSSTCKSILTYGCDALYLKNSDVKDLDKIQGKLIKSIVGIGVQ